MARTRTCIALPIILQSFSFLLLKKMDLGENLLQNPKSQRMEMMEQRERESESEKSSSITLAQDMVSWE
jgi:hypothetical protein